MPPLRHEQVLNKVVNNIVIKASIENKIRRIFALYASLE